jgi:plasmid stabilization system protein ParE
MTFDFVVRPLARKEMNDAAQWYADRNRAAAARFSQMLAKGLRAIEEDPYRHPIIDGETRRLVLAPFPYSLLYRITAKEIVVLACFHGRRNPAHWRSRQ